MFTDDLRAVLKTKRKVLLKKNFWCAFTGSREIFLWYMSYTSKLKRVWLFWFQDNSRSLVFLPWNIFPNDLVIEKVLLSLAIRQFHYKLCNILGYDCIAEFYSWWVFSYNSIILWKEISSAFIFCDLQRKVLKYFS